VNTHSSSKGQVPVNFPQTFLPDRRLLAQLLVFAADNGSGDKVAIGAATGIPTGESTGKVEPIIRFAECMGLVSVEKNGSHWQLAATRLGKLVLAEDAYLSEPQTLWLLHLMLCRRHRLTVPAVGLADAWFAVFCNARYRLGTHLTPEKVHTVLVERYGDKGYLKALAGVILRTYQEEGCFARIPVVRSSDSEDNGACQRLVVSATPDLFPSYAAFLYLYWDELFSDDIQVALDTFSSEGQWIELFGWQEGEMALFLDWMRDNGLLRIERYTGSPMLTRLVSTGHVLSRIYSDLV
jgi:hypothetical protein